MKVETVKLEGVLVIEPRVFSDPRGFFMETYHQSRYRDHGIQAHFVQDNLSFSVANTLRGLHYQYPQSQAKLVQVFQGEIWDVAVDIRRGSPTFGEWVGVCLSGENKRQLFIPEGFAHGFAVLSESAVFTYKCSDFYSPETERGIIWNDPDLAIEWPLSTPLLSDKDQQYGLLRDIETAFLPSREGIE
ncbi:MAG: dTDP-4-dehydrorhamnose 3,5-epimerase [Thermodesulfobacteriota bacterium]